MICGALNRAKWVKEDYNLKCSLWKQNRKRATTPPPPHPSPCPNRKIDHLAEAEFLDVIGTKSFFLLAIHSQLYSRILPPLPPTLSKSVLKLDCNVNIMYENLKSDSSQDYAQKHQEIVCSWIRLLYCCTAWLSRNNVVRQRKSSEFYTKNKTSNMMVVVVTLPITFLLDH